MTVFRADSGSAQRVWDNSLTPIGEVRAGTTAEFVCPGPELPPAATNEDVAKLDPEHPHALVGPVAVSGAKPGDTLVVEVLSVKVDWDYGQAMIKPGFGLLPDEFSKPYVHNFKFRRGYTLLKPGVRIPLQPFLGVMGVALPEKGVYFTHPPRKNGGNIDIRHLTEGSRLMLPVWVEGALFTCGDGHAAQGDGEVCITAIETAVRATLRFDLLHGQSVSEPRFYTPNLGRPGDRVGFFATTAAGPDLRECCQRAIRYMIDYLVAKRGLTREEAYVLCSLVVDLKVNEMVDDPNAMVSAYLPLSVFTSR